MNMGNKAFKITESWEANAEEWIRLLERDGIASRKYTNDAILETVKSHNLNSILDLGCGEGWLTRALSNKKNRVVGIDSTEVLLKNARLKGSQNYYNMTYEEIVKGKEMPETPFDAVVLNFCLYQNEEVSALLQSIKKSLLKSGLIFIQTLHPSFLIQNNLPYKSQWMEDSWKGLKGDFVHPHSWYARTLEDWISSFRESNLVLLSLKEVINDKGVPLSILFTLRNE